MRMGRLLFQPKIRLSVYVQARKESVQRPFPWPVLEGKKRRGGAEGMARRLARVEVESEEPHREKVDFPSPEQKGGREEE